MNRFWRNNFVFVTSFSSIIRICVRLNLYDSRSHNCEKRFVFDAWVWLLELLNTYEFCKRYWNKESSISIIIKHHNHLFGSSGLAVRNPFTSTFLQVTIMTPHKHLFLFVLLLKCMLLFGFIYYEIRWLYVAQLWCNTLLIIVFSEMTKSIA